MTKDSAPTFSMSQSLKESFQKAAQDCIGCNRCQVGCPLLRTFGENPKDLLQSLAQTESASLDIPYACFQCNYCTAVCPKAIDMKALFFKMRLEAMSHYQDKLPSRYKSHVVRQHQKNSFSKVFSAPIVSPMEEAKTLFFPGCSLMGYSPQLIEQTYNYLLEKNPEMGIYIQCCGKPTLSLGDEASFEGYKAHIQEACKQKKVRQIITACPNCTLTLEGLEGIEVLSLWTWITDIGLPPEVKGKYKASPIQWTLHDPCALRSKDKVHQGVRDLLKEMGVNYTEMPQNRGQTLCCGSGGMVGVTGPQMAQEQRQRRRQAAPTDYILSYCQECCQSLAGDGIETLHLLDLIFHQGEKVQATLPLRSLNHWYNRHKIKRKILKGGGKHVGKI